VRRLIHDVLVEQRGMTSTAAWSVAGVGDLPNFRRQWQRCRRGRPGHG
jgi:hypothetical protein